MKFILQTINNKIVHDFCFVMERAIEYLNWKEEIRSEVNSTYLYCEKDNLNTIKNLEEYTPVGTVEFFYEYFNCLYGQWCLSYIKPLNIPIKLLKFTGDRNTNNVEINALNRKEITSKYNSLDILFIKSNSRIKCQYNGKYQASDLINNNILPDGEYQISNYLSYDEIISEYRCFIYHDKLYGIKNYSGDFSVFPNVGTINKMMQEYKWDYGNGDAPEAYTLDVAIMSNGNTEAIECHEFFSCGLYGFDDYDKIPFMLKRISDKYKKMFNKINNLANGKVNI